MFSIIGWILLERSVCSQVVLAFSCRSRHHRSRGGGGSGSGGCRGDCCCCRSYCQHPVIVVSSFLRNVTEIPQSFPRTLAD
eukprot:6477170-Amphidinium_carterae.1